MPLPYMVMIPLIILLIYFPLIACVLQQPESAASSLIRVENMQIHVNDAKSAKQLGKSSIPSGEKFTKILRLEKHLAVKINFRIVEGSDGKPIEDIQQVFMHCWHSKTVEPEIYFIAKENNAERGVYGLEIVMPRDVNRFKSRRGRYSCELLIGDQRYPEAFRWTFIDVFVDIAKPRPPEPRSYEPRNRWPKLEPGPELVHAFKPIETCNFIRWPLFYIFTVLCALPSIVLATVWLPLFVPALKAQFTRPNLPWAQLFLALIASTFAIYGFGWIHGYTVDKILQILPIIGLFCFMAGHNALKIVAKERIEIEGDAEEEEEEVEVEVRYDDEDEDFMEDEDGFIEEQQEYLFGDGAIVAEVIESILLEHVEVRRNSTILELEEEESEVEYHDASQSQLAQNGGFENILLTLNL